MFKENKIEKIKQNRVLIGTILAGTFIFAIFLFSSPKKMTRQEVSDIIHGAENKINLTNPSDGIKAEDRWLEEAEDKLDSYDEFQKSYSDDKVDFETRLKEIEEKHNNVIEAQQEMIELKSSEINDLKTQINVKDEQKRDYFDNSATTQTQRVQVKSIQSIDLNLENLDKNDGRYFKSKEYVPAGAYAPAVIISGVDASVGISSQSDPRPVLLRVKGEAKSSIYDGSVQKTDIRGCIITGAASGDLSSEKVYVKLVKMTCGQKGDLVFEVPVKGYVAGQGKSGIRGNVISREGDLLAKSFLAGLVGGFGQGLSQRVAPPLNFSNGLTTQGTLTNKDVARKGLGQGIATSSDRLANYMINRAEQYQPVVSIPSGIDVEIVFVEGFRIGDGLKTIKNKDS